MRGSVAGQVSYIWEQIDGIGESKVDARADSDVTSLKDDRAVSDKVHSYEYKDEVLRTAEDLGNFARENFGEKNYEKIDGDIVQAYIDAKIADGVTQGTLSNYISHLAKVETALIKIAEISKHEYTAFTREDLREARENIKENAGKTDYVNRAYASPGAVISNLERGEHLAGRLQLEHGLRVSEATRIGERQLNGNTLTYIGKGGKEQSKELSPSLANSIRSNMENGRFSVDQNHYRESLRESSRVEGDKYSGSHGLRYNYAQNEYVSRLDAKIEGGMKPDEAHREALAEVSKEMGHNREEITEHYLGR